MANGRSFPHGAHLGIALGGGGSLAFCQGGFAGAFEVVSGAKGLRLGQTAGKTYITRA